MTDAAPAEPHPCETGLPWIGDVPWGTHLCHFYRSADDLREVLVPYFQTGLHNNEQCLWITATPLDADRAWDALARVVPDLAERQAAGQIEILEHTDWYTRFGTLDSEQVLTGWLEREQKARAAGLTGLRITGNTFFLEREEWDGFAEYEAAVHRVFAGRRILALCSYSLDRCTIDDVLDVLQNHKFALARRASGWEKVQNATELLSIAASPVSHPPRAHVVHFFREEAYPADEIAAVVAEAPRASLLVAPAPHLEALRGALHRRGVDPDGIRMIDTADMAAAVHSDRSPIDPKNLRRFIDGILEELASTGEQPRLYGEFVDHLCAKGRHVDAVVVEQLWNEAIEGRDVLLHCGYDITSFSDPADATVYSSICGTHGEIRIDALEPGDRQVLAGALMAEIRRRRQLETDRFRLRHNERDLRERLSRLQRVTAALAEPMTSTELEQAVGETLAPAAEATGAVIVARDGDTGLREVGISGIPRQHEPHYRHLPVDAPVPSADVFRAGAPDWLHDEAEIRERYPDLPIAARALAGLPLLAGPRKMGVLVLGFAAPQTFAAAQRALLVDIARQMGSALERVLLHEESLRNRKQLEQANRAKDEFLAMLAHELRNPLAAIRSAGELLDLVRNDPARLDRARGVLGRQTAHMAKLIDDLLDVSRVVWGKVSLDRQSTNLPAVIHDVLQDRREQMAAKGIELRVDVGNESLWVHGDAVRLTQAIDNVLSNAIKFTDAPGEIAISATKEAGSVAIRIRDSGDGIEPDLLPHVFEPFQQATQPAARTHGGLGLGLALVRGIVEMHGGRATASSPGKQQGTLVTLWLPLIDPPADRPRAAPPKPDALRILIVEDNADAAAVLEDLLETAGHQTVVAPNGRDALEVADNAFRPNLILCDIGLPGDLNGYDVARALQARPWRSRTHLVALSGYGRPEDRDDARAAGFDHHLTKPVTLDDIHALIARMGDSEAEESGLRPDSRDRGRRRTVSG